MKKYNLMKKLAAAALSVTMLAGLTACGGPTNVSSVSSPPGSAQQPENGTIYHIGICNYTDDASLNQINENIQARLKELGDQNGVIFAIEYENPNSDSAVMNQIISNFIADDVDLMVGIATPVAMAMQEIGRASCRERVLSHV